MLSEKNVSWCIFFPHCVYVGTLNLIASIPGSSVLTFYSKEVSSNVFWRLGIPAFLVINYFVYLDIFIASYVPSELRYIIVYMY